MEVANQDRAICGNVISRSTRHFPHSDLPKMSFLCLGYLPLQLTCNFGTQGTFTNHFPPAVIEHIYLSAYPDKLMGGGLAVGSPCNKNCGRTRTTQPSNRVQAMASCRYSEGHIVVTAQKDMKIVALLLSRKLSTLEDSTPRMCTYVM